MKNAVENTDAGERNNLPINSRKPGDVVNKRTLPKKSTGSTAIAQNKQCNKAMRNKTSLVTAQSKQHKKPTKKSKLIKLLSRKKGCSIVDLVKQLGWQAHTIRAAITRLRSEGYEIARSTSSGGKTIYQITKSPYCGENN